MRHGRHTSQMAIALMLAVLGVFGVLAGAWAGDGNTAGGPLPQPTMDGNLSDMKALVVFIQNPANGARAFAKDQLDNITNSGCAPDTGVDGFQDEPLEAEATPNGRHMHSPINVGNAILIYVPDSDGIVLPASEDDSWLAMGVNISNGDGDVCIDDPGTLPDECAGNCKLTTSPDLPLNLMVPFDADGNGNPCTLGTGVNSRWFPDPPALTFDENSEAITFEFFLCVEDPADLVFDKPVFDVVYQQRFSFATQLLINGIDPALVQIFPPPGSTCAQIRDRALQNPPPVFPDGLRNNDFEVLINKVDSQVTTMLGVDYLSDARFRLAELGVTIRSDGSADLSNEDSMFITTGIRQPEIELTKEVRCSGEGDNAWRESVTTVPGATIQYKIEVENSGNVPLTVTLTDVLNDVLPVTANVDLNSLQATLFRPSDGAGVAITPANAAAFGLNPNFFTPGPPGFLAGVAADEARLLGNLDAVGACEDDGPSLGDRVVLVFSVIIGDPDDLCDAPQITVDIINSISAVGVPVFPEVGDSAQDIADVIDTTRESLQDFDDNVVTTNVLCREVEFVKEVRILPSGPFVTGLEGLEIPNGTFPVQIEYRYTVENLGDVSEDIVLNDLFLCQDVTAAANVDFVAGQCALCQGVPPGEVGEIEDNILAGQSRSYTCRVQFNTLSALRNFLLLEDNRTECRALNDQGGGDTRCYRNCATLDASADTGDSCDGAPVRELDSFATICNRECEIDVTKRVRCIESDCDLPNPQNFGDFTETTLQVAQGGCVQYEVEVENIGLDVPICALRFNDLLSQVPAEIAPIANTITLTVDGIDCPPPACFNSTGALCELETDTCPAFPGGLFQEGQIITIRFNARVTANANAAAPDPVNSVTVEGSTVCPAQGANVYTCEQTGSCCDSDSVDLDILPASLTCSGKDWAFRSDNNADCEPDAGNFSPFQQTLDLRDDVFPVLLRLRVRGTNTGQVPLNITANDAALTTCVNSVAGVDFVPGACELGTTKLVTAGDTAEWLCDIRIETAAAARALDACDGSANGVYNNTASVTGVTASGGTDICVQPDVTINGTSTCSAQIQVPPPCDFSVVKNVVCIDGCPGGAATGTAGDSLNAIPGARSRFEVRVTNNSSTVKIPRICMSDLLGCPTWICGGDVGDTLSATIGAANVTADFAAFSVDNVEQCFTFESRPAAPWIAPSETLVVTFDLSIPNDATTNCLNTVSASGYSEVCAPPPDAPCDSATDSASINIQEPDIECDKVARAFNGQGLNLSFTTDLALPCNVAFPLTLEYRFTVQNTGETTLSNARACDPDLVADAQAAGFNLAGCALAGGPDGCANLGSIAPGGSAQALCTLQVPSRAAMEAFLLSDGDSETDCYNNTADAEGRSSGAGLCEGPGDSFDSQCSARVCLAPECALEVTNQVRCLDSCTAGNPAGPFQDSVSVAPGTCLEYEINILNDHPSTTVCRLLIDDLLSNQPGNITFEGGTTFRIGATNCAVPAGFNVNGNPFEFDPASCIGGPLLPGQTLRIRFKASIPTTANAAISPTNTVSVDGAPQCPTAGPNYCCEGDADSSVDILRPSLTCDGKEWAFQWDSDANCEPNAPFGISSETIDLRDKVFPVRLRLTLTGTNDGEVPLDVVASDPTLVNCVNALNGIAFVSPPTCEIASPTAKLIMPGASAQWVCEIRIDTAQAARDLDACDGNADGIYHNSATVVGTEVTGGSPICVPPNTQVQGDEECSAQILIPPPCDLDTSKTVTCISGCTDGTPTGAPVSNLQMLPGGFARYTVEIKNMSPVVKIPRVCLTDVLTCNSWRCAGGIEATLAGTDVSANFAGLTTTGTRQCFGLSARPAAPWIAPGETLTVSFDVQVPTDFSIVGGSPDCENTTTAEGYTEACIDQPPLGQNNPCRSTDNATIDVKISKLVCNKRVSIDVGNNGTFEFQNTASAAIDSTTFPIRLVYKFAAQNGGETTIKDICIVDDQLIADATAAGVAIGPCDLTENATCSGAGSVGGDIGVLTPGQSSLLDAVMCELVVANESQWTALGGSDLPRNGSDCYENIATAKGTIDTGTLCAGAGSLIVSTQPCSVEICVTGSNPCPVTKAKFDIWNENEVRFSGTERCVISWDEHYLSSYTELGHPNHFIRSALQTDKGKARIDGLRSPVVCGAESIPAPMIGVAAKRIEFDNGIDWAGSTITGSGIEPGRIRWDIPDPPKPAVGGHSPGPYLSTNGDDSPSLPAPSPVPPIGLDPSDDPDRLPIEDYLVSVNPVSGILQKGSIAVFPKVEIKWDANGTLIQDTFLSLTNDGDDSVRIQLYFVNGDQPLSAIMSGDPPVIVERAHPGCNWVDNGIALTHDQSVYWSALSGQPEGVSPFTILDPGFPPGRPDDDANNLGGRVLRGYVLAWAVNPDNYEIRWNHLAGTATIVNYADTSAWTYSTWNFQSVVDVNEQEVLLDPIGQLDLNGIEYEYPPSTLVFDFYAAGAEISTDGSTSIVLDTDLTLWVAIKDLVDASGF